MNYKEDIKEVATLELPWEQLNGCNILITGATGLIGSCIVEVLMSRKNGNYHIYAAGRNEERARVRFSCFWEDERFHFLRYDVISPLESDRTFHYIIHAASNASPNFFMSSPVEVIKSNVEGVSNLMDYGMKHGMRRFLFVSSGEIYGEGDGRVFAEEYSGYVDCNRPRSCYPSSKRAAETLCAAYNMEYGVDYVTVRPSHTYGPNFTNDDNRVYAQFIRNILRNENIVMKSSGAQFRSWCYVVDCVSAILHVLLKGQCGAAYNIADNDSNISIKDLAEMIADIGAKNVIMEIPDGLESAGYNPVKKSVFSTQKLQDLGWNISGTMKDKMKRTITHRCKIEGIEHS